MAMTATERSRVLRERRAGGKVVLTVVSAVLRRGSKGAEVTAPSPAGERLGCCSVH